MNEILYLILQVARHARVALKLVFELVAGDEIRRGFVVQFANIDRSVARIPAPEPFKTTLYLDPHRLPRSRRARKACVYSGNGINCSSVVAQADKPVNRAACDQPARQARIPGGRIVPQAARL